MNTVIKFNSFISILLLFSLFALFNEVTALAIQKRDMPPDYLTCDGIKFISPKAGDKLINYEEIEVVWETNSYTEVNGLDLYNENGKFVKSFWEGINLTENDDKVSGKVKLDVPPRTKLPDKFTFKILGKGEDDMPCSTPSESFTIDNNDIV